MSLLRVCAYAKCLNRRSLFEKCAARVSLAECCQLCGSVRDGAVRRISETPLQLQRRNVYYVVPKKDHANKRVLEQSQLLDVLEARIQQLQSDTVLDVQRSKVQFVKATSSESKALPGKSPKSKTKKKTDIPKEVSVAAQLTTGRWMKKLYQEKQYSINCIKQAHEKIQIQKKLERAKRVTANTNTEKPDETISTTPEEGLNLSKKIKKRGDAKAARKMEELQDCLTQHVRQLTFSKRPALLLEATNATPKVENTQCIKSYLEVCAVVGDIQRASLFLLGKHKSKRQRIHLTTDVYNIVMRMMAKQANISQIGNLFVMLNEAGLKPNVGSYSAALECMGRCSDCTPEVVTRCLTQMEKDNLCEDDLFNQCVFWQDEKEMVLKALHIVKPHYQPSINASNPGYTSLVEDYYSQRSHWKYSKLDMTHEDLKNRFRRQLNQEKSHAVTIESVEASKPVTKHLADMRNVLATQMAGWQKVLLQALRERKTMLANTDIKPNTSRINLYPHLCVLEDKEYVDIMLESSCRLSPAGETLIAMALDLGTRVHNKFMVEQKYHTKKIEKLGKIYSSYTELMAKDTKEYDVLPSELWRKLEAEHSFGPTLYGGETPWPHIVILELGTLLVDLMVKSLKMNSNILNPAGKKKLIPIMYHVYTYRSLRKIGFIKPHPILLQLHHEALNTKLTFDPCLLPMLCPPVPWTSVKAGAYLLSPTLLMRAVDGARQHEELLEQSDDLCPIYDSLNQLGNCPWTINKPILDIIVSIFNDKGNDKLDIPPPLSEAPKIPRFNLHDPTHTAAQKASMKKEVLEARRTYGDMHSQRMSALYTFSIANHLRDEIFWFPHNMDFRGRTYPCPPHLNHLGSDVTRSVLLFAEGRPLGPKGLDWLKIHLVNLTGQKKKSSLEERLKYANDLMDLILDSADKPLNGKKWWTNADEPWQALACCMEIANAVRSPDPTQFISRFPVHQDGSCNGLQHYAALGRDAIGAKSVNLMPSDLPQDVYSGIAQQVERFRLKDAEKGVEIAKALEGFISRKVVKQTVMTVVYGVTRYGGRLQIEKRLKEIDEFPKDHVWDASHYLVRLVFSSLQEMFTGTRKIQDWLTESAWLISKCGHSVQWVTPLGLPVIQPYHKARVQLLQCPMQSVTQEITHDPREKPDTNKQKNAFPPNFIHSLDSTHMMLTSLHCNSAGLTFVSVHDCFWTHALTVDTMNKICREQFVALHSQPILHNLSSFLLEKYGSMYPEEPVKNQQKEQYMRLMLLLAKVPETGDFDLQQVKESVFFFS